MRAHFSKRLVGIEPQQPHRMHDAPMDRLQPVAHVGQRAVHDGRQRIGEIALLQRLLQVDRLDVVAAAGGRRNEALSHACRVSRPADSRQVPRRNPKRTPVTRPSPSLQDPQGSGDCQNATFCGHCARRALFRSSFRTTGWKAFNCLRGNHDQQTRRTSQARLVGNPARDPGWSSLRAGRHGRCRAPEGSLATGQGLDIGWSAVTGDASSMVLEGVTVKGAGERMP